LKDTYRNRSRDEATEKIEHYIIQNKLAPNTKILSERDMCTLWDFNRTTLRSAIQRLIVEGKLYQKKGSGTYVAAPKLTRDLQDLTSLSAAAKLSGRVITNKVLSTDIMETNKQLTQKLHLPPGHKVHALTRLRYLDGEPVIIENSFMDYQRFSNLTDHDFEKESLYEVIENESKVQIVQGEERVGIAYATDYEAEILGIKPGNAVFYFSGVTYDEEKEPVEYFKSIVRADKMRFASVLKR
jgi:Transcriptional regulators